MTDYKEIKRQARRFAFFAAEFEGADFAACRVNAKPYDVDVCTAGNAAAVRAKAECEKLIELAKEYHKFIAWVIRNGGL